MVEHDPHMHHSFNDEIMCEIARISLNELILPPEYESEYESEPVAFADSYLKKLYTLWQRTEIRFNTFATNRGELLDKLEFAEEKEIRKALFRKISELDASVVRLSFEVNSLEHHFYAEAYRRIPDLYTLVHPTIASNWGFYGETLLYEVPDGCKDPTVELDPQVFH